MEAKSHTFLHALKLWLIWNIVADISLVVFFVPNWIAAALAAPYMGYKSDVLIFSILLLGIVLGSIFMGLIQWIVFKSRIKHSRWWILATALAGSVAGIYFYLYLVFLSDCYVFSSGTVFLAGAIGGAVIGLMQGLVLHVKVSGAGWWVLGSILGWACAVYAAYALSLTRMGMLGVVVGLTCMSMITGVAYAYLFRQSN